MTACWSYNHRAVLCSAHNTEMDKCWSGQFIEAGPTTFLLINLIAQNRMIFNQLNIHKRIFDVIWLGWKNDNQSQHNNRTEKSNTDSVRHPPPTNDNSNTNKYSYLPQPESWQARKPHQSLISLWAFISLTLKSFSDWPTCPNIYM